jgi:hypothetical protein
MIVGGRKLTAEQIQGRAAFAAQQGLDPISEVHTITDKEGKTMAHTMSINGLRRKNQEMLPPGDSVALEFVEIPKERMAAEWAYAYECRLRDGETYRQWQKRVLEVGKTLKEIMGSVDYDTLVKACGPAPVTTGIGVVYKGELSEWKDRNFNPIERCKKRAEVSARRHRFPTSAAVDDESAPGVVLEGEIIEQASEQGEPENAPRRSNDQILNELGYGDPLHDGINTPSPRLTVYSETTEHQYVPDQAPEPAPEPTPEQPELFEKAPMTLEQAEDIRNRDGMRYGDIATDRLAYMANALSNKPTRTPAEEDKLLAIGIITRERNKASS